MLAGRLPEPFENWVSITGTLEMTVNFSGRVVVTPRNI
jgi:hypothetical protein